MGTGSAMLLRFVQHSQQIVDMYINWGRLITLPQTPTQIYGVLRQCHGYPKPVLQQSHSTRRTCTRVPLQSHSKITATPGNTTAISQQITQQVHSNPTADLQQFQQYHSNARAIPQQYHRNHITIPQQYHSNPTAIPQQSHRHPTATPQEYQKNHTAIWQQYHSSLTGIP